MDRSKFDLTHEKKLSFDNSYLIPIQIEETMPGAKYAYTPEVFVRVAPLVAPIMHRMDLRVYSFHVPLRLIWNDSEEFFHRKKDLSSTVTVPRIRISNDTTLKNQFAQGTLADYFGIKPIAGETITGYHYISQLPFRAYQKIYEEYFVNQETQTESDYECSKTSADVIHTDTTELLKLLSLRRKNFDKDYFHNLKTTPSRSPSTIGYVTVQPRDIAGGNIYADTSKLYTAGTDTIFGTAGTLSIESTSGELEATAGGQDLKLKNLNDPLGIDLDDIRKNSAWMRWMEAIQKAGYRYIDYLKAVWGVDGEDYRLGRPEYLGGFTESVRISDIPNTSDTATAPQGNLAGKALASRQGNTIYYEAKEHGYMITLMCMVPKPVYFQGIDPMFYRLDHMDWANPMMANLGRDNARCSDIWYNWSETEATNIASWGYKERYADYKQRYDTAHGDFRTTLAFWHMGKAFVTRPTLTEAFSQIDIKTSIFAVTSGHHFYAQVINNLHALLPLPYESTPIID